MIFASNQHKQLWEACTDTFVNIDQVIALINNQPNLLKDGIFRAQLIAKVTELEENSPLAENAFQYTNLKILLNGKIPLRREAASRETVYAYLPHNVSAESEEIHHQQKVSERFFRVNKPLKQRQQAEQLYQEIRTAMSNGHTIILDGRSMRSLNVALARIISENSQGAFPPQLKFRIGNTNITCNRAEQHERKRQRANFWLSVDELPRESFPYGHYDYASDENKKSVKDKQSVGKKLSVLAVGAAREQELSRLMTQKTMVISSFQENEFNQHAQIRLAGDGGVQDIRNAVDAQRRRVEIAENIHYLNGLNILRTVTEVVRRLSRDNGQVHNYQSVEAKRSDALPVASYQSRSAKLLAHGNIRQQDVFGESSYYGKTQWEQQYGKWRAIGGSGCHRAQYGVGTGVGTIEHIDVTEQKAKSINSKVESDITRISIGNGAGLFKAAPVFASLDLSKPEVKYRAGRNAMRQELGEEFGGNFESDGENYSDDEDIDGLNNLFENRFGI